MAVLTRAQKKEIASPWVRAVIRDLNLSADLSVTDIMAAVQAIENFLTTSQRDFVASLPEPFKSSTTDETKDLLLFHTLEKRVDLLQPAAAQR